MTNLLSDAKKTPLSHVIIVTLFGIGLSSIPLDALLKLIIPDEYIAKTLGMTLTRLIFGVVAIYFIYKYGFLKNMFKKPTHIGLVMTLPALLVVVNNFPIIGVINGNVKVVGETPRIILYVIYCLSVGIYEETIFRGLVFPLCLIKTEKTKHPTFWAIALSSGIFGVAHLLNLLGGASIPATLLQVGYSFLIGGMCAISLCLTDNLIVPIILHFIYDVGGLFVGQYGVGMGNQWDNATVIITAILGTIVLIYMIIVVFFIKPKPTNLIEMLKLDDTNKKQGERA